MKKLALVVLIAGLLTACGGQSSSPSYKQAIECLKYYSNISNPHKLPEDQQAWLNTQKTAWQAYLKANYSSVDSKEESSTYRRLNEEFHKRQRKESMEKLNRNYIAKLQECELRYLGSP